MYHLSDWLALPPPVERKPSTISTTSSVSLSLSGVRSSWMISFCMRVGSDICVCVYVCVCVHMYMHVCVCGRERNVNPPTSFCTFFFLTADLRLNLLSHSSKCGCSVDILPIDHLGNI